MSVVINGSAGVTTNSGAVYNGISAGTAVASTSGTSIDFTSIPSWVKRITVMFNVVSTNGSSNIQIQLGDSGGVETTGYSSASAWCYTPTAISGATSTTGFLTTASISNGSVLSGLLTIGNMGSNIWAYQGTTGSAGYPGIHASSGSKTLSDTLDRVRITTVNGTDTFDAGSINILYE